MFKSLELVFNSTELMFKTFEHRFLLGIRAFTTKDKFCFFLEYLIFLLGMSIITGRYVDEYH